MSSCDQQVYNADTYPEIEPTEKETNHEESSIIAVGMEFKTLEEGRLAYFSYARYKGFGVRSSSNLMLRTDKNLLIGKAFVCDKEGKKIIKEKDEVKGIKRKRETRTGCEAKIRFSLNSSNGMWRVSTFNDTHNHEYVTPSRVVNIRSHRQFHRTPVVRNLVSSLHSEGLPNIGIKKAVNAYSQSEDFSITSQQCHDQLRKERKEFIGHECTSVILQFQEKMKNDPMFWFSVDVDKKDNTLKSIFWADGRSRKSFLEFFDVIVFDVTYRTNKFKLPFAPFTGINHHGQSTLFGCALIMNEKLETFEWLFKEWLKCMFNVAPKVIITDQDASICAAIKKNFPDTRHRYCSWHLNKHATEHLGLLHPSNAELAKDYEEWYYTDSIEESEKLWKTFTEKHKGEKVRWLLNMYEKREHWVPAYWRGVFTANMNSSQRSESMNSFFDGFVNASTPLNEFTIQYDKALKSRRILEKEEDHATLNSKPKCESGLFWQEQAAKAYTRKMYSKFYNEFITSQAYHKKKISKDSELAWYKVGRCATDIMKWRTVSCDTSHQKFTCSCAMFEIEGIICRHIMAIFRLKQISVIPDQYILRRWSIDARYRMSINSSTINNQPSTSTKVTPFMIFLLQAKHHRLMKHVESSICHYEKYDSWLTTQLARLSESNLDIEDTSMASNIARAQNNPEEIPILISDPTQPTTTKGRPRTAVRYKSGVEMSKEAKKVRQNKCSFCQGSGHNISTCETRRNGKKSEQESKDGSAPNGSFDKAEK